MQPGPAGGCARVPAARVWPLILGITAAVVAGVALLAAGTAAALLCKRRRRQRDIEDAKTASPALSLHGSVGTATLDAACKRMSADSAKQPSGDMGTVVSVRSGTPHASPHVSGGNTSLLMSVRSGTPQASPHVSGGDTTLLPSELWRLRWLGPHTDEQVEVGPLLGRGSFGRVYKGRWNSSLVAVKVVDHLASDASADRAAAEEQRVAREALLSTSLSHPNVIATYKICTVRAGDSSSSSREGVEAGHRPTRAFMPPDDAECGRRSSLLETWLVQEFADKGSLADAIVAGRFRRKLDGSLDTTAILKCLNDVASGMAYLHSAGIVHGDLKAANVLLRSQMSDSRGFLCKICDFSLSRLLDEKTNAHVCTTHGTASWMPPGRGAFSSCRPLRLKFSASVVFVCMRWRLFAYCQEVLDEGLLTRPADLYSFGLLIWSLVAGEEPWKGMSLGAVYVAVCSEDARPPVPEDCPEELAQLMRECWARDPTARPSFFHVQQRLLAALRVAMRASQIAKAQST